MIHFSMASLLMSVLFGNLLLILIYFVFLNTKLMLEIGVKLLTVLIVAVFVRLIFPFELFCSTNIYLPEFLSRIIIYFQEEIIFSFYGHNITLWKIFLTLWLVGIAIASYRLYIAYHSLYKFVRVLGQNVTDKEPYHSLAQKICDEHKKNNVFQIFKMANISSPMIYGFRKPHILLPKNLNIAKQDLYYILSHEMAHFFHHDLWLKLFSQFLCILFWWNPFVYLLRKQIFSMLEIRIDSHIVKLPQPTAKYEYMRCLTTVKKYIANSALDKSANASAITFCSIDSSLLMKRFHMITSNSNHKRNKRTQIFISSIIACLFIFSVLFIFEANYISPQQKGNSFALTEENSFLVKNPKGGYDIYIEGKYLITIRQIDDSMHHLKIYNNLEEVDYYE